MADAVRMECRQDASGAVWCRSPNGGPLFVSDPPFAVDVLIAWSIAVLVAVVVFAVGRWLTRWEEVYAPSHLGLGVRRMEQQDEDDEGED